MSATVEIGVTICATFIAGAIAVLIVILGVTLIKKKWPDVWKD